MSKMWILLTYENCSNESENAPDCIDFGLFFKKFLLCRCVCRVGFADAPLTVPQGKTFLFFLSNQLQAMFCCCCFGFFVVVVMVKSRGENTTLFDF